DVGIDLFQNQTIRVVAVSAYLCPSDKATRSWTAVIRDLQSGAVLNAICDVASANYVGMYGVTEPGVDGAGVFFRNSAVRLSEINDGTANTIAVGERSVYLGDTTWTGSVTRAVIVPPVHGTLGRYRAEHASGMVLGHAGEGLGPGDPFGDAN